MNHPYVWSGAGGVHRSEFCIGVDGGENKFFSARTRRELNDERWTETIQAHRTRLPENYFLAGTL